MKVSATNLNSGLTTSYQQDFSGYKIKTNNWCDRGFQAMAESSKHILAKIGKKHDVKLSFIDNYLVSTNGLYYGKLNSFAKIQIKDIDKSKNMPTKIINKFIKKSFKAEIIIPDEVKMSAMSEQKRSNVLNSLNLWIKEQEAKFLELKKIKK